MNNTDLIYLIKHFMHNELKAVEEVIDSPLSEFANLIKVLQSCQGKVVLLVLVSPVLLPENSQQLCQYRNSLVLFTVRKRYTATLEWWRKTMLLFLFQTVVRRRKSQRHCLV